MSVPNRQIGWGAEENLLAFISKQLEYLTSVAANSGGGGTQTLQEVLDNGNSTTTNIILNGGEISNTNGKTKIQATPIYTSISAVDVDNAKSSIVRTNLDGTLIVGSTDNIQIYSKDVSISGQDSTFEGMYYADDYSANFTDRSLVDKAYVDANSGSTLTRQEFTFTGSQSFTLSSTPSAIYAVFVNGQELNSSQYSFVSTTLTILNTLEVVNSEPDKVNIVYTPTVAGVLAYYTKAEIDALNYETERPNFVEVNALTDLPTPVSGVITLVANYTYLFLKHIDLLGSRLVCGQNTVIVGWSSENCSISSTGLSGATALITSNYSLPIRSISFTHGLVFNLQGDGVTTTLDWFGVNLLNCLSGGTINNYANFVMSDSAILNSGGFKFDGTIGTIGVSNCLFNPMAGTTGINILPTCNVSHRLRIIYSSFIVSPGETGVNFSTSATVGDEKYILDTINFSGGGTYTSGVTNTSNKALFTNCVGIANTATRGFMYMINNTVDTPVNVPNVNVWLKALGTTTADSLNSKFNHANNRLTYTGAFNQSFLVTVNTAVRASNSNQNISIGIAKNGTILTNSEMTIRTSTSNQEHPGSTQYVIDLVLNDYLELFVKNSQSPDVRVSDLNFSIIKIPS